MPAEQQGNIYINGWKSIDDVYVYVGGWKRVNQAYTYHNGVWKRFYAYDATPPTVVSFTLNSLTANSTYSATTQSVSYTIVFSEPVTGLTTADFSFVGSSTTWTIGSPTNPSGDQKTYVVTVTSSGVPTTGSVQIRLANNSVSDIVDGNAFNQYVGGAVNSPAINIDNTKPTVSTFSTSASGASTSVAFSLNFAESVSGLTASDISIGGTSTGWSLSSITGSGSSYTVNVSGTNSTAGTLILTLAANSASDAVGNTGPASNVASGTFTAIRQPGTPTITSLTSSAPTLHDRTLTTAVSVPASLTTVDVLYLYYYDANDNYIDGSVQTYTLSPATSGAFTYTFTKDMGRNPGTKYFVRAQTRSTQTQYATSARSEVTTQADKAPPVASSLSMSDGGSYPDPGYPGRSSASRQLTLTWSNANLTDEVSKITVYIGSNSHDISKPADGWSQASTSRTVTGLTWGTSYTGYIRSTDIYGGTNSTADSTSVSATTTAAGSTAQANFTQTYTNTPLRRVDGSAESLSGTNSGSVASVFDGDVNTYWISGSQPASAGIRWQGSFSGYPAKTGAVLDRVYLTSIRIRTVLQHVTLYTCLLRNINGVWDSQNYLVTDQYSGQYFITNVTSQGGDQWSTTWTGDYTLATPENDASGGRFTLYFTMNGRSYNGTLGITNTNLRAIIREVDFTAVVSSYNPAYNY